MKKSERRKKPSGAKTIQSVERAFALLETLSESEQPLGLGEVAAAVGLHDSTAFHLINTMVQRGYVQQDPESRKYRCGFRILDLAGNMLDHLEIRNVIRPYLEELMQKTGETVNLVFFEKREAIHIDQVQTDQKGTVRVLASLGSRVPLYTGVGKVYLASMQKDQLEQVLNDLHLTRFTKNTITDRKKLEAEIEKVRAKGYAVNREEREEGAFCIGAPLFGEGDHVFAAVSISVPAHRITEERIKALAVQVMAASREISKQVGIFLPLVSRKAY
ncbi:MAG: IclR family transcriptional regulator [Firmicutes bacterium]|nr:IclR family transcriptional regulator [Bacillota bacterium]